MTASRLARLLTAPVLTAGALLSGAPMQTVSAEPCSDVEVVFARGTSEAPGVGGIGQAFVDALGTQAAGRTVAVYPVDYPASSDFNDRIQFARTVVDGIRDAGNHVQTTAANCPNTRIVLGGYSQGAAVAGYVTAATVPEGIPAEYRAAVPNPMPPEIANHVAAVALFGKPSDQFMRDIGAPPITIGPPYLQKTIDQCIPDDTICNGAPVGTPSVAHALYAANGLTAQAATFAADRLRPIAPADAASAAPAS